MGRATSLRISLVVSILSLAACATQTEEVEMQRALECSAAGDGRLIRANAVGSSWGFYLFGFIPIGTPSQGDAVEDLYSAAGPISGRPVTMVNVFCERTKSYFILFTLEKLRIRADLVEAGPGASPVMAERP